MRFLALFLVLVGVYTLWKGVRFLARLNYKLDGDIR